MKNLLLKSLLVSLVLVPNLAAARVDCERHPIYCDILTVKPSVNRTFAMELSNYIYKYSRQFGTNPKLTVAIAMQESSMINQDRHGTIITKKGDIVRGITDVGVFQLHVDTIKNMNESLGWDIDFMRLRTDVEYQTYWHVRILRRKINVCRNKNQKLRVSEGNEWSCYHSYTYKRRQIYLKDVSVHLDKLAP